MCPTSWGKTEFAPKFAMVPYFPRPGKSSSTSSDSDDDL